MANVLVCVKRVPGSSGEVLLTSDAMSVDAKYVGYMMSPHEECAVELAIQIAADTDGEATVLSLGSDDSIEQMRDALAVGCKAGVLIEADAAGYGPADVAGAIADVVTAHAAQGKTYDLVLLGNDAADSGDFQVGIRLAYELDRPVVVGISTITVADGVAVANGQGPGGVTETFEVPLPAVVTVLEGGVEPRYPSIPGRMKAKKAPVEYVTPERAPVGTGRVKLSLPPAAPSTVTKLGEGKDAAPVVVETLMKMGVLR
ncbi:MAG: electron transfer flavoprotein subunit beta/FixA family protein [Actinomycetales bacterium]